MLSTSAACCFSCVHACAGICPHKKVVCLVVDECHRAKGNSDVVLAVKKLREEKCKFRVVGLSATPGSSNEAIQVFLLFVDRPYTPCSSFTMVARLIMFHVLLLAWLVWLTQCCIVKPASEQTPSLPILAHTPRLLLERQRLPLRCPMA